MEKQIPNTMKAPRMSRDDVVNNILLAAQPTNGRDDRAACFSPLLPCVTPWPGSPAPISAWMEA